MVASFTLLVLELVSILVHGDLWIVYRYQKHWWEKLLFIIPERQRKTYQGAYRNSLKRNYFCAQDKIDVSGTTFTACFTVIYTLLFFLNLFSSQLSLFAFWLQGLPYYTFMLYAAASYRSSKEFCFYCRFGMIQGLITLLIGFWIITVEQGLPWVFLTVCGIILFLVIVARQVMREEKEEQLQIQREKQEYLNKKKEMASKAKVSTEQSELLMDDKKNEDGATDRQEDENGDEIIEIVDCPGVDGARQRSNQGGQSFRMRM